MENARRIGVPLLGLCQTRMNIDELQLRINDRRDRIKEEEEIKDFIGAEGIYVSKLKAVKESRRSIIADYEASETDLGNLFGCLDSITELHEYTIPGLLAACRNIEDILKFFANHIDVFKIYVQDQWMKSRNHFEGKQAIDEKDIDNLNLPECKIKEYLNFHQRLKYNFEDVKDSENFSKSIQAVKNLFLQMQYAKELASVKFLPPSADGFVQIADNFQVKVVNSRFIPYRVYFCASHLYLVSEEMRFDFDINMREVSLHPMEDDKLLFEITTVPGNKVYVFKSTTPDVKNEWTKLLRDNLYMQVEEEKSKIRIPSKIRFAT